ncbi:MAG: DNA polymerase III subunit delta [Vulcanimicrobiota bacterium]
MKKSKYPTINYMEILGRNPIPGKRFYLLSGSDLFTFNELIKKFQKKYLADDPSRFNYHEFDCSRNTQSSEITNLADEYPFGSNYKLIVVNNAHRLDLKQGKKLSGYLENPCQTSKIVITENEQEIKEKRPSFVPHTQMKSALAAHGIQIQCELNRSSLKTWIGEKFQREKKKIDNRAIEILIEMVGNNLWNLHQEIIKLSVYAHNRSHISANDVKEIVVQNPQSKIYNLNEYLGSRQMSPALKVFDELLKEKIYPVQVISALENHFSFLHKLKMLSDKGNSSDEIAKKIRKHPFYVKKSLVQADNFSGKGYETVFDMLARADAGMKSGMDPRWVMELTIIQICRTR